MNDRTLLQACRLLFGEEVVIGAGFLDYLQSTGLKSAFRKRARETHPDAQADPSVRSIEEFFAVQQAYQVLAAYLQQRENRFELSALTEGATAAAARVARPDHALSLRAIGPILCASRHRSNAAKTSVDRLYRGPLPERPLLFGHFLYYCGLTTWRTITAVLVQQRRGRPRCGELGARLGMFQPEDIARILAARSSRQPFGETAMALGMLDAHQLSILLNHQQRQQKKFGAILVEKELVTLRELAILLTLFRRHNRLHDMP